MDGANKVQQKKVGLLTNIFYCAVSNGV